MEILLSYCEQCGSPVRRKDPAPRSDGSTPRRARWPRFCTLCKVERAREYDRRRYSENPTHREAVKGRARRWSAENLERKRERDRAYYVDNAEQIKERARRYGPVYSRTPAGKATAAKQAAKRRAALTSEAASLTCAEWHTILQAFGYRCAVCRAPWDHMDHIVPISKGGQHTARNVWPLCAPCNLSKSSRDLADWLSSRWVEVCSVETVQL